MQACCNDGTIDSVVQYSNLNSANLLCRSGSPMAVLRHEEASSEASGIGRQASSVMRAVQRARVHLALLQGDCVQALQGADAMLQVT